MKEKIMAFAQKAKTSICKFAGDCKKNAKALMATAATIIPAGSVMDVYAGGGLDEGALMGKIIGLVTKIFRYIGILLLAWSIGMLVLAFKNEDADSKSRAMMMMVVSIILVALGSILTPIIQSVDPTIKIS